MKEPPAVGLVSVSGTSAQQTLVCDPHVVLARVTNSRLTPRGSCCTTRNAHGALCDESRDHGLGVVAMSSSSRQLATLGLRFCIYVLEDQ